LRLPIADFSAFARVAVILSGAKLQRSPESFRGEARLSISDLIKQPAKANRSPLPKFEIDTASPFCDKDFGRAGIQQTLNGKTL